MTYKRVPSLLIFLILLILLLSGVGGAITPARADGGWTAYNDCVGTTGGNTTAYAYSGTTTGLLKNYETGADTGVTVTITKNGSISTGTSNGAYSNSGTDAYDTFYGKANMQGVINYANSSGWWVDVTFTGLDPAKTYTFATTANRNDSGYTTRVSRFTISDMDGAANASTSGVEVISNESVAFSTGYNTENGYVARWTAIQPGADGDFTVRAEADSGNQAYGPSVFMLQEEASTSPTISISGTLSAFSSQPEMPSAEQSYTVAGSNLTEDIVITAPADFEISTTSGDDFGPSLTLPQSDGSVAATPIYVRFNRATEGTSSGDITHTSSGATTRNVAVSGTAMLPLETWTAYNDCAWVSGQTNTNITTYTIPDDGTATGLLKDYATGTEIPVTVTFSAAGNPGVQTGDYGGSETDEGTDAYTTFHGIADVPGVIQYGDSGWWVEATFTGLDPAKTYTFATTANRDGDYTDRITRFTLLDAATAINTSSSGVTRKTTNFTEDTSAFNTGNNTETGYVASWAGIQPGDDGDFTVRTESDSEEARQAYAFSVFALQQETTDPTITISGTPLDTFGSAPGTPSTEQSYTVAGRNLTADISITAPADFEISTTSGDGFGPSLTLPHLDGTVAATPIYVRFNRAEKGTSSGDITHTSPDATPRNVAVSGTAGNIPVTVTFQEGLSGYAGTVDTHIMEDEPDIDHGGLESVEWDADDPYNTDQYKHALIRFDDIFGSGPGQIPAGAFIQSATLRYVVSDTGDSADVNEVTVDWAEAETWDSFGGDPGLQEDEYGTSLGSASGASTGLQSIDVTASLVAWLSAPSSNKGWIFRPTGDDGADIYSSEYTTATDRPLLSVTYYTDGPPNRAPGQPVLVRPSEGAADVSLPPTLEVTASDPDEDDLTVAFYGRPAGTTTPGEDFTIVVLPDTQNAATGYPEVFNSMTQWIADNKTSQNIVFATSVGDIVNTANDQTQWTRADEAYDILDAANVAYSVGPGNHDLPLYSSPSRYNDYFGVSRFEGKSWYRGHYGDDNYNNYSFFSAGGMDFILINLQYNSTSAMLDWADGLLKAYPDRQGIVVQHNLLNTNDSWQNQAPYTALKDNPNLFLMLCGHMHASGDGAAYREELGDDGHTIHVMMADYQDFTNGGGGYLRILRFSPTDDTIYATTYSAYTGASITTYPDQMDMAYEMAGGAAYTLIDTVSDVANGANAAIAWPDLTPDTNHQWYAIVSDGLLSTTGPTWSFTTAAAGNTPPVITESDPQAVTMSEDGSPTPFVLALNATDVDPVDILTWSISIPASHGIAAASGTGESQIIGYSPQANYNGPDSFGVQVSDGNGGIDTITVNITISAVNDAPACSAISQITPENTPVEFDPACTDVDDLILTYEIVTAAQNGTASVDAGKLVYAPDAHYSGSDTFTYRAGDGDQISDPAPVSMTITPEEYTLAVNITGSGSVARVPDHTTYHYGDVIVLTATPDDGWAFSAWSGDLESTDNPAAITMTGNKTITATFNTTAPGILGDVNGDEAVTSTDALIILSCDAGIDTSEFCPMNCGDVDANGLVNSTDALIILSYDAEMTVPFPVGQPGCPASVTAPPGCNP